MRLYEYRCPEGHITEERRPIEQRNEPLLCHCGKIAERKISIVNNTFGWRFSENFYKYEGYPHELVRNV